MCPDNKIKSLPGNTTNCDDDTACDGKCYVSNPGHTACGKLSQITIKLIPFVYLIPFICQYVFWPLLNVFLLNSI